MQHKDKSVQMAGIESARSEVVEYHIHEKDRSILSGRRIGRVGVGQNTIRVVDRRRPRPDRQLDMAGEGTERLNIRAEKVGKEEKPAEVETRGKTVAPAVRRRKAAMNKSATGVSNRPVKKKVTR